MADAQLLGLARGAAHEPLGALGRAGGPAEREQALRRPLLLGGGELLAAQVVGELLDG
jgi:hypothetical protein